VPKRLLLFAATTGYQIREFADAAHRLGLELTLATDHCDRLGDPWGDGALAVKFDHRMMKSLDALRGLEFDGVAAVGDRPAVAAAVTAEMLGIPFHPAAGARACHDKYLARQLYQAAGMRTPWFWRAALTDDAAVLARRAEYPCVLKPLGLSGSRGVIRANNEAEFAAAFRRISRIGERHLQVEHYIPGREFALEGLVTAGRLQALAIFDKPDPLEGPFFEESIYVTPSRETHQVQQDLVETVARAVRALGLRHGPVHASGVMMIPIAKGGIYEGVEGTERASAVEGIEDVLITATAGQRLVRLPEGASYLGFLFARGDSPAAVEESLRRSHAELRFHIATALETLKP
jgi:hypothetical protein